MLKATDFTGQVLSVEILDKIMVSSEETGIKEVDFSEVTILDMVHEKIAWYMVYYGLIPRGIEDSRDIDKIAYMKQTLLQPSVENIKQFREIFKKRFKIGEPCILDRTMDKGINVGEGNRAIIMVVGEDSKYVYIRRYHSSKVQPKFFKEEGGPDSKSLYINTQISYVDLFNKRVLIEHPKNSTERKVLDLLFVEQP